VSAISGSSYPAPDDTGIHPNILFSKNRFNSTVVTPLGAWLHYEAKAI